MATACKQASKHKPANNMWTNKEYLHLTKTHDAPSSLTAC